MTSSMSSSMTVELVEPSGQPEIIESLLSRGYNSGDPQWFARDLARRYPSRRTTTTITRITPRPPVG
jgi:hypothetical protein